jgi:hypothetical protein
MTTRNRIKDHRRVRAGDLVPHELNWREHPALERDLLQALYQEIGFARSLLAYELPDGRLKLIDGHLRRDIDPDMLVDVEVLDVDDVEARKLLLSIDPLAGLAETNNEALEQLLAQTKAEAPILKELWETLALPPEAAEARSALEPPRPAEQFLILVECADEPEQVRLLARFQAESIQCRALVS